MKVTGNFKSQRGFTLLEVMIALAIISVALVTLLSLGTSSIRVHGRLQHTTQATLLAQQKMAEVEVGAEQGTLQPNDDEDFFATPFADYRWHIAYTDTPLATVKMVTVTVSWGTHEPHEGVDLTSFILQE